MGFITCVQGQAEGHREQLVLIPISKGIPQDVLQSFGVQESQEGFQGLHLALDWEQSTPLFSGELSGRLVQSWVSGFVIHLRIGLSEVEGDAFSGALEVDRMEDCSVVEMEGDMEVVDTEFKCRD